MQVNNYNTVPSKSPHEIHGSEGDKGRCGHTSYGSLRKLPHQPSSVLGLQGTLLPPSCKGQVVTANLALMTPHLKDGYDLPQERATNE